MTTDPVCQLEVDEHRAWELGLAMEYDGKVYYFCSDKCRVEFERYPGFYSCGDLSEVDLSWWVPGTRGS